MGGELGLLLRRGALLGAVSWLVAAAGRRLGNDYIVLLGCWLWGLAILHLLCAYEELRLRLRRGGRANALLIAGGALGAAGIVLAAITRSDLALALILPGAALAYLGAAEPTAVRTAGGGEA